MTKGVKIAIGVTLGVTILGVATYLIFFRKGRKGDTGNSDNNFLETLYVGKMDYVNSVKDNDKQIWINLIQRPKFDTFKKDDIAVIDGTNFDGEYPVLGTFKDSNGKLSAFRIDIDGKYKPISSKDETFAQYGNVKIMRKVN